MRPARSGRYCTKVSDIRWDRDIPAEASNPLSRPYGRGGARREAVGGEGLAESDVQTLTSQASLGPLLSREKRERVLCVCARSHPFVSPALRSNIPRDRKSVV